MPSDATQALAGGCLPDLPPLPPGLLGDLPSPFAGLADAAQGGLRPDPDLTVSEWADANRILSGKGSAEAGPYRTARAPFIREIADALSPSSPIQRVAFMKGAQIGGTEAGNSWLGYIIANAPGPIIAVQPTVELAKRFSKQRVDGLIETTAALRDRVKPARARDSGNTILQKDFPGGMLVLTGANSAVGLRSMPARYAFLDEVDAYPADVEGEGDPVALAEARTKTYSFRKKIFLVSTPKIAGRSRIEREYLASDQRRYFVPCPHCGAMQWLRFEHLRWEKGRPETAAYYCEECGAAATEADKTEMLARGEWRATAVPETPRSAGFHVSSLYSPVGWMAWADVAAEWEKAQKGGPEAMRTFRNTVLGETWRDHGEAPDWERLLERREAFAMGVVPAGALLLTAACDNQSQPERLEVAVWAWGPGYESWLVDTRQIAGSPGAREPWDEVARIMAKDWPCEGGGTMRVSRWAADTGGQHTAAVYAQLRRLQDPRLLPIKGVSGWNKASPVNGPTMVDVTEGGRKIRRGLRLWTVSVDSLKSELYRRLWLGRGDGVGYPAGWVHLPEGMDAEQVKQLVAEQLVTVKDRRGFSHHEWRKLRPNEMLDLAVYSRAALSVMGADRYGDRFWTRHARGQAEPKQAVAPAPETAPAPLPPPAWVPALAGIVPGVTVTGASPSRPSRGARLA